MEIFSAFLLADGRLPVGGHAHSGGVEQAVDEGKIHDLVSLETFLVGRLLSTGRIDAHVASRSCELLGREPHIASLLVEKLDVAVDARLPSPAARAISRAQGSAYLSVAMRVIASSDLDKIAKSMRNDPHIAVAIGLSAGAAGLDSRHAAALACYHAISGPAFAALRLLGLDPVAVAACLHAMGELCDQVALEAATSRAAIPAPASPILDVLQESHHQRKERLFAS